MTKAQPSWGINLADPDLFGQDDAQYEDDRVFYSFAVERPELRSLVNDQTRFLGLKAPKGSGKTALFKMALRHTQNRKQLSVLCLGSDIFPDPPSDNLNICIKQWKHSILRALANEVGKGIGFACTDDDMSLVENAEQTGAKPKAILMAVLTRIKIRAVELSARPGLPDAAVEAVIRKLDASGDTVWVWIDEVDQYFQNTEVQRVCLASMMLAARELTNKIPDLRIRFTIRPNVWAILESTIAPLSNLREHVMPIAWSEDGLRQVLAKRIEAYLGRTNKWKPDDDLYLSSHLEERDIWLIKQVFDDKNFDLGRGSRPPHVVLSTLSARRPRWLIELCKASAGQARQSPLISIEHVKRAMKNFGNNRLKDFAAEFRPQCAELAEILTRFTHAPSRFSRLHNLLDYINKNIVKSLDVQIVGAGSPPTALEVARFLFQIDFVQARAGDAANYQHLFFEDRPDLLASHYSKQADAHSWEIHPLFRNTLSLDQHADKPAPAESIVSRTPTARPIFVPRQQENPGGRSS